MTILIKKIPLQEKDFLVFLQEHDLIIEHIETAPGVWTYKVPRLVVVTSSVITFSCDQIDVCGHNIDEIMDMCNQRPHLKIESTKWSKPSIHIDASQIKFSCDLSNSIHGRHPPTHAKK